MTASSLRPGATSSGSDPRSGETPTISASRDGRRKAAEMLAHRHAALTRPAPAPAAGHSGRAASIAPIAEIGTCTSSWARWVTTVWSRKNSQFDTQLGPDLMPAFTAGCSGIRGKSGSFVRRESIIRVRKVTTQG
jgi:hypothetical protein